MTDTGHRHAVLLIEAFLEGKETEHQIDGARDLVDTATTPGPDRGTDVVHGGYALPAQALFQAETEIRGIDADEEVWRPCDEIAREFAADAQQFREALERLHQPHDRQSFQWHATAQALGFHEAAADAFKGDIRAALPQGGHQARAEDVAGHLAGEDGDTQGTAH